MEKKLEVKNLVISFKTTDGKVQAVRNISFDLNKGETLAIVGESGSGKSVTSKAIIGISSGNALIEGGEILYDGQDLLRISEEEFHKIRGDKIAMIFQDPLSSLNPIVKIGTQLTEAMILKNKASRVNSRKEFNKMLSDLEQNLNEAENSTEVAQNKENAAVFNKFCIVGTKLENEYNMAVNAGEEVLPDIEDLLLNAKKEQKVDYAKMIAAIVIKARKTEHNYFVLANDMESVLADVITQSPLAVSLPSRSELANINKIATLVLEAQKKVVPNYFTLGYYVMAHPEEDLSGYSIEDLNAKTRKALDDEFMLSFLKKAALGLQNSEKKAYAEKKIVVEKLAEAEQFFSKDGFTKKEALDLDKTLCEAVVRSIDTLETVKDSLAYTFKYSLKSSIARYFEGVANNPKEQARYDKQKAQWDKIIASGKTPEWTVTPAALTDIDLLREGILSVLRRLKEKYAAIVNAPIATDYSQKAVALIDYFKEKARGVVNKVTAGLARAKALKLMDEVGIPEPALRFKQYPFEFSGGMRQRIVIAIALAANPDILICDEPTTALDVTIQAQILELINKIKKERNLSIIFITHDLGVVANMADRIAVMYAGKIVEYGTDRDIFYDPRHPYTWALLASMPDLETKEKLEAIPGTPPNMIYPPVGDAFAARNKYAMQIDFEQQPPLFKINDTHYAATWLLHPDAPKVDPPKIVTERITRMKNAGKKNG